MQRITVAMALSLLCPWSRTSSRFQPLASSAAFQDTKLKTTSVNSKPVMVSKTNNWKEESSIVVTVPIFFLRKYECPYKVEKLDSSQLQRDIPVQGYNLIIQEKQKLRDVGIVHIQPFEAGRKKHGSEADNTYFLVGRGTGLSRITLPAMIFLSFSDCFMQYALAIPGSRS